jgi:hypothetical protein
VRLRYSYLCTYDLYGPYVMFLMRADPLLGQVGGGWALEIETFLVPVKWGGGGLFNGGLGKARRLAFSPHRIFQL